MVDEQEARYSSRWPTADVTREDAKAPASKAGAAMVLSCTLSYRESEATAAATFTPCLNSKRIYGLRSRSQGHARSPQWT